MESYKVVKKLRGGRSFCEGNFDSVYGRNGDPTFPCVPGETSTAQSLLIYFITL